MSRWTMPLAWAASSASAISMAKSQQRFQSPSGAVDDVLQRRAFQKLHGDEGFAVLFTDVVDGADVGMVQRGGGFGFPPKAFEGLRSWASNREEI